MPNRLLKHWTHFEKPTTGQAWTIAILLLAGLLFIANDWWVIAHRRTNPTTAPTSNSK